jgi:hypothetical protein
MSTPVVFVDVNITNVKDLYAYSWNIVRRVDAG